MAQLPSELPTAKGGVTENIEGHMEVLAGLRVFFRPLFSERQPNLEIEPGVDLRNPKELAAVLSTLV